MFVDGALGGIVLQGIQARVHSVDQGDQPVADKLSPLSFKPASIVGQIASLGLHDAADRDLRLNLSNLRRIKIHLASGIVIKQLIAEPESIDRWHDGEYLPERETGVLVFRRCAKRRPLREHLSNPLPKLVEFREIGFNSLKLRQRVL